MSKTKSAAQVTAQEALEMLASAVSYCQQAGLTVYADNVPNLALSIPGALLQDGRFVPAPIVTSQDPPAESVTA